VYRSDASVSALYREWFELTSGYPVAAHWLFDSSVAGTLAAETLDSGWSRMLVEAKRLRQVRPGRADAT
jgi:hypothetical protein